MEHEERAQVDEALGGHRLPRRHRPAVYRNARHSRHSGVLEDPRVRVIPTDGRNYILATPKYYDVITAEPSNPWIAGIANLYTREFYRSHQIEDQGRRHLRPVVS